MCQRARLPTALRSPMNDARARHERSHRARSL